MIVRTYERYEVQGCGWSYSGYRTEAEARAAADRSSRPCSVVRIEFEVTLTPGTRLAEMARPGIRERIVPAGGAS